MGRELSLEQKVTVTICALGVMGGTWALVLWPDQRGPTILAVLGLGVAAICSLLDPERE